MCGKNFRNNKTRHLNSKDHKRKASAASRSPCAFCGRSDFASSDEQLAHTLYCSTSQPHRAVGGGLGSPEAPPATPRPKHRRTSPPTDDFEPCLSDDASLDEDLVLVSDTIDMDYTPETQSRQSGSQCRRDILKAKNLDVEEPHVYGTTDCDLHICVFSHF